MTQPNYNGNPNLKQAGVQLDWEPWQIDEFVKCSQDPIYFIEKYVKIVTVDNGVMPMQLYDFQRDIIQQLHNNKKTAAIVSRQMGKTTVVAAFLCWYIIFNDYKTAAILANKATTAREILGRVQFAYELLPKWIQQGVVTWNKGSFELENGQRVLASSTQQSAIRGFTCVAGQTLIQVRNKIQGEVKTISIEEFANINKINANSSNTERDIDVQIQFSK